MGNHEPTKRKLDQARKDGRVAKSPYFSQSFPVLIVLIIFIWQTPKALVDFKILLNYTWVVAFTDPQRALQASLRVMGYWSLLLLGSAALAGIAAEFVQVRFTFDPQLVLPKSDRVDIAGGAKQVLKGLINPWPLILRGSCAALVMYYAMRPCILALPPGMLLGMSGWSEWFTESCFRIFKATLLVLFVNGLIDFGVKWRAHRKQLMMTDEEVRREHKDDEGDPLMKHMRRHEHQSLINQDIVRRIRRAKVLVVESN